MTTQLQDFNSAEDYQVLAGKLLTARIACVNTMLCVTTILADSKDSCHVELCKLIEKTMHAIDIKRLYESALTEAAELREHV